MKIPPVEKEKVTGGIFLFRINIIYINKVIIYWLIVL